MKKILPVIFLIVFCLGCEEERKGQFLERGIVFFDQGNYKASELEIKNAIQEDPSASEAYFYMAQLNEKHKKYKAMKINLLEAVKLDPEKLKARLKLSKVHLLFNETDEALKQIEHILISSPELLDALAIKASVFIRQKNTEQALVLINNILQKDPDHIEALSIKVVILIKEKLLDQAVAVLTPALQKNSDNLSLHLLKIQLDSLKNDVDAVVKDYERLVELKPDNVQIKLTLANVYQKAKKLQKAENILKGLVDKNPNLINAQIALLNLVFVTDEDRAMLQFDTFIEKYQNEYGKVMLFTNWLLSKNKKTKARGVLNSAIANNNISDKHKDSLNLMLAKMEVANKKYNKALTLIDNILNVNAEHVFAKTLKAEIQLALGKYNDAGKLLEEILWQKPNMDQALSLLGFVSEMQGDVDKAIVNYEHALKVNPKNMRAVNFIVNKEIAEGHVEYAIEVLERTLSYLPSQLMILTKLVELNINESKWDVAEQYITKIKLQKNGQGIAEYLKGNLLQNQKKYEEAITVYKKLLEKAPWLKDALVGMAECYMQLNQQSAMMVYLDDVMKTHPNVIPPYILKSQLLSIDKKYKKAISFMNDLLKQDKMKDLSVYTELGRLYGILGNKDSQQKLYLEGLIQYPDNTGLMLQLASVYENKQMFSEAVDLYKKILIVDPNHNVSRNNLATLLLDQYGKVEDINSAVQMVSIFKQSKQSYFLDTYGWAMLKSGALEEAFSIFKQVVLLSPNVPVFRYHLAVAYDALGDSMSASSELKQALYIGKGNEFPEKVLIKKLLAKLTNK